jgi:nucleoside-diphosphate-sugar epimerase
VIFGDGQQRRDFVFVDDIVRANLLAAEREQAVGGIFNIGSGKSITVNELAGILQAILQTELVPINRPPREGDIRLSEADISGAAQALGYRPKTSIAKGLQSTVEWFVQERVRLKA